MEQKKEHKCNCESEKKYQFNLPKMFVIDKVVNESGSHVTLFFKGKLDFKPGQFVMVWIPRLDEKPFTISYHNKDSFSITVEAKGNFTKKLVSLKEGDRVGIRGAYGNGFKYDDSYEKVCIIAGGCGIAPVAPLIDMIKDNLNEKNVSDLVIIQGSQTREKMLFKDRFENVKVCTDDGSYGFKGFTTHFFEQILDEKGNDYFDMIYACGPEIMMKGVFEICEKRNINVQCSLERYMRCGFGICGACVCGKERVCVDGPVFNNDSLRTMDDFGSKAMLKSGKEVELGEYFSWRCG